MTNDQGSGESAAEVVGPFTEIMPRASDIIVENTPRDLLPDTLFANADHRHCHLACSAGLWFKRRRREGAQGWNFCLSV